MVCSVNPLLAALEKICLRQGFGQTYWIAFSGGLDSCVLLHCFVQLRQHYPLKLRALHVNHHLSAHADNWVAHCEKICVEWQVDFSLRSVNAKAAAGESPEEIARDRRYAIFAESLMQGDCLVTAHHQDDQAETILLQMVRGAGTKGLSAMPLVKKSGGGFLLRPFLEIARSDLLAYARENNLRWVEDDSNADKKFSRNFIRHDVMPVLQGRWPQAAAALSRSARHCAEAQSLLDEMAREDLQRCAGTVTGALSVQRLLIFTPARQKQVLRYWLTQQNFLLPSTIKMQHILQDMLLAGADKTPLVSWKNVELRRYRDDLFAMEKRTAVDLGKIIPWDAAQGELAILPLGVLQAELVDGEGLKTGLPAVTVRFRRGGEVCRLPNRGCSHSLKKLFWEWNVLPWERDRLPLVFVEDQLAAVPGYFVGEGFSASAGEKGYVLSFKKI